MQKLWVGMFGHMKHMKILSVRFVVITVLSVVGYFVFALAYLSGMNEHLTVKTKDQMINDVKQVNEFAYLRFDSELRELESIASMLKITDEIRPTELLEDVKNYNKASSTLNDFAIVLPNGVAFCDDNVVRDFSREEFFRNAIKGKRSIIESERHSKNGKKYNTYAVPIFNGTHIVAVLATNKPVSNVIDWVNAGVLTLESFMCVVDVNGDILTEIGIAENQQNKFYEKIDLIEYADVSNESIERDKAIVYEKYFEASENNQKSIDTYIISVPLGISNCSTITIVPKQYVTGIVEESMKPLFLMFLIVFILLIAYTVWLYLVRVQYRKNLIQLVYRDQLTGLMNWNAFLKKYEEIHSKSIHTQYTLILCDIDGFKVINDVYGQHEGNRIIQLMADVIGEKLKSDEYFARVSADNFVILLHTKNDAEIITRVEEISDTVHRSSSTYAVMTSFGIYKISGNNIDLISMHDRAKLAKNTIKGNHQKSYIFYDDSLRQNVIGEKEIENEMEKALENDQFKLYLQPKYSFNTDEIVGAEALVRWEHPEKGIISPGVFIPIFERNEFIRKLDFYIYERVCEMLSKLYSDEGRYKQVPVSVNFSRVHLNYPDFCGEVRQVASSYKLNPNLIEIELTESIAINDKCELNDVIDTLRDSGFVLTIDDFGSGYSSLNILKDLNIDVIKFDMEFLRNSTNNPKGKTILKNLVRMAKELKLITVAEGVETIEQVQFLRSVDCDIAQGFFYARPMPKDYFEKLIARKV